MRRHRSSKAACSAEGDDSPMQRRRLFSRVFEELCSLLDPQTRHSNAEVILVGRGELGVKGRDVGSSHRVWLSG